MSPTRRAFIHQSALAGAFTIAQPLDALARRLSPDRRLALRSDGYGPLAPARDDATGLTLLELPDGFRYSSYGWTGDPLTGGKFTPGAHDGMAAFRGDGGRVLIVRNH